MNGKRRTRRTISSSAALPESSQRTIGSAHLLLSEPQIMNVTTMMRRERDHVDEAHVRQVVDGRQRRYEPEEEEDVERATQVRDRDHEREALEGAALDAAGRAADVQGERAPDEARHAPGRERGKLPLAAARACAEVPLLCPLVPPCPI